MKKLAVLVSGTGSILQAILQQELPVGLVVADRECRKRPQPGRGFSAIVAHLEDDNAQRVPSRHPEALAQLAIRAAPSV